eukprot:TRINITY_DN67991_c8_g6_i1.p1 TRINITY_DN67991_c8_g6~~TRINITY_DN67991_c8_g6_i1.p1  ORF type:complete len:336 (-),score=-4.54 TRINITY_DN67991_c8_g6_i1:127-1134(-)
MHRLRVSCVCWCLFVALAQPEYSFPQSFTVRGTVEYINYKSADTWPPITNEIYACSLFQSYACTNVPSRQQDWRGVIGKCTPFNPNNNLGAESVVVIGQSSSSVQITLYSASNCTRLLRKVYPKCSNGYLATCNLEAPQRMTRANFTLTTVETVPGACNTSLHVQPLVVDKKHKPIHLLHFSPGPSLEQQNLALIWNGKTSHNGGGGTTAPQCTPHIAQASYCFSSIYNKLYWNKHNTPRCTLPGIKDAFWAQWLDLGSGFTFEICTGVMYNKVTNSTKYLPGKARVHNYPVTDALRLTLVANATSIEVNPTLPVDAWEIPSFCSKGSLPFPNAR